MKKLFLALICFIIFTGSALAAPFLVCDSQLDVDEYIVVFDGTEEVVPYNDAGGYVVLKDLAGITEGDHNVSVKAKNIWGESSEVPFVFTKALPGIPQGTRLKK